jgi:hypothetical protein
LDKEDINIKPEMGFNKKTACSAEVDINKRNAPVSTKSIKFDVKDSYLLKYVAKNN